MSQIYVIYRPEDTRKKSKEIITALQKTYGATHVQFPDFDGYLDVYQIEQAVQKADYLLVVIGNYWANLVDEAGQNLLTSVYDPVHMAIATAVKSSKRIVPILLDGASMPNRNRLPRELRGLTMQEPVKLEKNVAISKSLNKGLKDIIHRENFVKIPQFIPGQKTNKVSQPRSRPQTSRSNSRTNLHWVRIPIVIAICVFAIVITILMGLRISSRISLETPVITAVQATTAPTFAETTIPENDAIQMENTPQIVTPARQQITIETAKDLVPLNGHVVSIASTDQFIFSTDETLFIFASTELQEVQVIDVKTNSVLKVLNTSPYEPLVIQLSADGTLLHVLMSNGVVQSWGIPSQ